jgi:hypothetical protein
MAGPRSHTGVKEAIWLKQDCPSTSREADSWLRWHDLHSLSKLALEAQKWSSMAQDMEMKSNRGLLEWQWHKTRQSYLQAPVVGKCNYRTWLKVSVFKEESGLGYREEQGWKSLGSLRDSGAASELHGKVEIVSFLSWYVLLHKLETCDFFSVHGVWTQDLTLVCACATPPAYFALVILETGLPFCPDQPEDDPLF